MFKVILIINKKTGLTINSIESLRQTYGDHNQFTTYTVDQIIVPNAFDCNIDNICTNGIHFFNDFETAFFYDYILSDDFSGTITQYDGDGTKLSVIQYVNGVKNGESKSYDADGFCSCHHYVNGIRNGLAIEESYYYRYIGSYLYNLKNGLWECIDKIHNVSTKGDCVEGFKNGEWTTSCVLTGRLLGSKIYDLKDCYICACVRRE
jgi:hypothetical protein